MIRYIHIFILILTNSILCHAIDQLYLKNNELVNPQLVHEHWRRHADALNTPKEERHADSVTYSININGSERLLRLTKNIDFLSKKFVIFFQDAQKKVKVQTPKPELCHYHGFVEGYEDSLVALSTCDGIRGVILIGNDSYGVEPVQQSKSNEHLLFLLKDSQQEPFVCGLANQTFLNEDQSHHADMSVFLRSKRALPQTKYVELVLVVDHLRFVHENRDSAVVREKMVQLANLLDSYYKMMNIRISLVGLEIFKQENPFSVEGTAEKVLRDFVQWRRTELLPRLRHDVAQLIVGRPESYGGVLGMAFVGTVCSVHNGGGINVFGNTSLQYFSTIVAHELGHNLGMNHDTLYCNCGGNSCVMGASASGATKFSNCSENNFENLILRGGGVCLRNQPTVLITVPRCGNGFLESEEQCDCGSPQNCTNKCCDAATCTLTKGSACATGYCCENCQIKVAGSPCRASVNPCDLPEFCSGQSEFCPSDFYLMDGLPCADNTAYCYEGRCQTLEYQCKQLFGSGATKADDKCFAYVNLNGDKFGNCGNSGSSFIPCATENAMCGKLQCKFDSNFIPSGAAVTVQDIVNGQIRCMSADFNLGPDVPDPAYVKTGTVCAPGKACVEFNCKNASVLDQSQKCNAQINCSSNGVCNDQFRCHCNNGWAPPFCNKTGRGGSIDSGPAQIDYSLRDGLLIFFLLVVPILVLLTIVVLYVFKRDSFNCCFRNCPSKLNRSSNAANSPMNTQANAQSNGNARAASQRSMTQPNTPSYAVNTSVPQPSAADLSMLVLESLEKAGAKVDDDTLVLCEQYQPSLKRDPMYNKYLDRIGQLFFGVRPKQCSLYGDLLGNLLNSLMGSGEEEDGEEVQEDSSPIELD